MGCTVARNKNSRLALRLWWRGHRSWEGTGLPDTKQNRAKLNRLARQIAAEIKARTFDAKRYLYYFPGGTRAQAMVLELAGASGLKHKTPTLREYALERWLPEQQPPIRRQSYYRVAKSHLGTVLLDARVGDRAAGELHLSEIDRDAIEAIRRHGIVRGLAVKTVKNAISGTLRAVLDRAKRSRLIHENPTDDLRWQRVSRPLPDPLSEEERDQALEYIERKHPRVYPLVATLALAGLRPSEATALRWSDVDLRACRIVIRKSRVRGRESATKTAASERTIGIVPELVEILGRAYPLDADVDTYVFRNAHGRPFEQDKVRERVWRPALRALQIRPRRLYEARHTFISLALSRGANAKFIAEYAGTSLAMIEQSYGRFIALSGRDEMAHLSRRRGENGKGRQKRSKSA